MDFAASKRIAPLGGHYFVGVDRRVEQLAAEIAMPIINASRGNPDIPTPGHIVRAAQRAVADPANHRYPPIEGTRALREAVALRYAEDHGVELDPDAHVAIFHGAHEGLMAAFHALLDPGDVVRFADPYYPLYLGGIALAGAVPATVPVDGGNRIAYDAVGAAEWATTRLLLLNYPNNPTGATAEESTFARAIELSQEHGFPVVNDAAYQTLVFDGRRPRSILSSDRELARSIEISTLSKSYSMAGWRIGYAVGNASLVAHLRRYQEAAYSSIFGAVQDAAIAALTGPQECTAQIAAEYEARRDIVVAGLRELGWPVEAPQGGFFVWLRVPESLAERYGGALDGEGFAELILRECGIAVAPGLGFGEGGRDRVRVSLVHDRSVLRELVERLRTLGA